MRDATTKTQSAAPAARHTWKLQPAERSFAYNGFPQYQPPVTFSDNATAMESNE